MRGIVSSKICKFVTKIELWIPGEPRPKLRGVPATKRVGNMTVPYVRDHIDNAPNEAFVASCWQDLLIEKSSDFGDLNFPLTKEDGYGFRVYGYALYRGFVGPKLTRPDVDNLSKLVYDALNNKLWKDDGMLFDGGRTLKWFAGDVEGYLAVIEVYQWKK